jgi:hypothetical protein
MADVSYGKEERVLLRRVSREFHLHDYRRQPAIWNVVPEPAVDWPFVITVNSVADIARKNKFQYYCKRWKLETAGSSSPDKKCANKNYLSILTLTKAALPLVLAELEREPDDWFLILELLAETNPVAPEDRTSFKRTREAWLKWGRENRLL